MSPLPSDLVIHILRRNNKKGGSSHNNATAIAVGIIIPLTVLSLILCAFLYLRLRRNPESRLHRWKTLKSSAPSASEKESSTSDKESSASEPKSMGLQFFTNLCNGLDRPHFKKPEWLRLSKPKWSGVRLPHWLKPSKQRLPLSSHASHDSEVSEREVRPDTVSGKYWSAEDVKLKMNNSTLSLVSKITKPAPSIFSSKSHLVSHEPLPQRPSSRHLKTTSKHISAQFMELNLPPSVTEDAGEDNLSKSGSKRDSRAVVTDLNWQDYEPGATASASP